MVDGYGYENLLMTLYKTPFYAKVRNDENRMYEARELRAECGNSKDHPGNCLEVLYVIAKDVDEIMFDIKHGDRTVEWFWMMLTNMDLTRYTNPKFNEDEVLRILDIFVERKFSKNGEGGPFPLRRPPMNMRKVEWWYALNWYINENFSYEFDEIEEDFDDE